MDHSRLLETSSPASSLLPHFLSSLTHFLSSSTGVSWPIPVVQFYLGGSRMILVLWFPAGAGPHLSLPSLPHVPPAQITAEQPRDPVPSHALSLPPGSRLPHCLSTVFTAGAGPTCASRLVWGAACPPHAQGLASAPPQALLASRVSGHPRHLGMLFSALTLAGILSAQL